MSNASMSRPGYASQRSPGAMAAALALNGGVLALLVALPASQFMGFRDPPLKIRWITLDPPPPPIPETEPDRKPEPDQRARPEKAKRDPTLVDPIVPLDGGQQIALDKLPDIEPFPGGGGTVPVDPPRTPVMVKARPDPRFSEAFHPAYPPALVREGLEGSVTVRVVIDERGRVVEVALVSATNPVFFEETRRQALKAWRFVPATQDGVAVRSEQTMTVRFRLDR